MAVSHRMYARSLFQAARDAGKLDAVHEQLGDFAAAISEVSELRRVLENPELGRRLGRAGRRRVEERFSWASVAERTERLYGEAIEEFRRAEETT